MRFRIGWKQQPAVPVPTWFATIHVARQPQIACLPLICLYIHSLLSLVYIDQNAIIKPQLAENDKDWNLLPLHEETVARDPRWPAVAEITRCPWFSRVWVVQEAGLSAQPQILYGNHDISWESFSVALDWFRHKGL